MSSKERLVYAIIKFLSNEAAGPIDEDAKESIEGKSLFCSRMTSLVSSPSDTVPRTHW